MKQEEMDELRKDLIKQLQARGAWSDTEFADTVELDELDGACLLLETDKMYGEDRLCQFVVRIEPM